RTNLAMPPASLMPSGSQVLRQLQAVAVGVVDVQEPDLAVQLEHDTDVDACRAQPLGLGADVVDVDGRGPALLGLALGQRDLHLPALELGKARLGVVGRLGEAEDPGVEVPARMKVADSVPDPHVTALSADRS